MDQLPDAPDVQSDFALRTALVYLSLARAAHSAGVVVSCERLFPQPTGYPWGSVAVVAFFSRIVHFCLRSIVGIPLSRPSPAAVGSQNKQQASSNGTSSPVWPGRVPRSVPSRNTMLNERRLTLISG